MPHPFFDAVTYPWNRQDGRELRDQLSQAIRDPGGIENWYRASMPANPSPLRLNANPDVVWTEALDRLTTARRLRVLSDLLLQNQSLAALHDAVHAIQQAEDSVEKEVFGDNRLFFDRKPLRDKLQRLASSESFRVLLIRGSTKSGKSWTQYMIAELAHTMGEPCIYLFEDLITTVDDVIAQCFASLGGEEPPPRLETEEAWFKKVCLRLQVLAAKAGQTTWLVVDDLGVDANGPRLDPMIRQFLDQFALSMANPAFRKWFRLVLIDYPDLKDSANRRGVPTKWRDFWEEDRPLETDVDLTAIAEFLSTWARRREKQLAAEDAAKLAADIIAAADAEALNGALLRPRLERLHDAVAGAISKL